MKRGCFLTSILVLTFVIGVGFYVFQKYGPNIKKFGKEKIFELAAESVAEKVEDLQKNDFQDSLKVMISEYVEKIDKHDFENAMDEASEFFNEINNYIEDQEIDSLEFDILKKLSISK